MIRLERLTIAYDRVLIKDASIEFFDGALTLIHGESGIGKSTLLYHVGLIAKRTEEIYLINDRLVDTKDQRMTSDLRKNFFGYVMQDHTLFEQYDVKGNLKLYASFAGYIYTDEELQDILSLVALKVPLQQDVMTLSGGERQRLAIACALCKQPSVLILDEPSSALDKENETTLFEVLKVLAHEKQMCVIVASHSPMAYRFADEIYTIKKKRIIQEKTKDQRLSVKRENPKVTYSISFYLGYIRYFLKKFKGLNLFMTAMMMICMVLISFSTLLFDHYMENSYHDMEAISNKQLLITATSKELYLDSIKETIPQDKINQLSWDTQAKFHPYFATTGVDSSSLESFLILPYYDDFKLMNPLFQTMDSVSKHGIYISNAAFHSLTETSISNNKMELSLIVREHKGEDEILHQIDQSVEVKGILSNKEPCTYMQGEKKFIYMYWKDLEELYQPCSYDAIGYIITAGSFDELVKVQKKAEKMGLGTNQGSIDLEELQKILSSRTMMMNVIKFISWGMAMVLLIAVQLNDFYRRRKEFALLIVNGLSNRDIYILAFLEYLWKTMVSVVGGSLCLFLLALLFSDGTLILPYLGISVLMLGFVLIVTLLLQRIILDRHSPESILRD